jgi:tyrosyl-tRNA synthetase
MFKSKFLQEGEARGFLYQCTDMEELDELLSRGNPVVAYWGTDPTGPALHVGHLFSLMLLRLLQRCGHKPLVLVGGATGLIGDPTLKDKSRPMMDEQTIQCNKIGIRKSIEKFIEFGTGITDAVFVDNKDWWQSRGYLETLVEIGPHMSVNRMLSFESVKTRLSKEEHMSFLEFNYMVLQAYDFYHLHRKYGCSLQLCGADQWGNVVAGVELVRRLQANTSSNQETGVIGLSTPLLVDSSGKKLGKSEGNAVWLNEEFLSPFEYFQYFRNVKDEDTLRFLKIYTDIPLDKLQILASKDVNELKKILAYETTKLCHGEEEAKKCLSLAEQVFENNDLRELKAILYEIASSEVKLCQMLKDLAITSSLGEARRLITDGGIKVDDKVVEEIDYVLPVNIGEFKLTVGKKKILKIKLQRVQTRKK